LFSKVSKIKFSKIVSIAIEFELKKIFFTFWEIIETVELKMAN